MDRQALAERFARLPREKQRVFLQALRQQGMDFALLPIVPAARACDADGTQRAALSYAQQRQWFLWELDPEASAYHIAGALRLRGRFDADAMQACFDALVARHEALRTVFDTDAAGQVFQRIASAAPCSFERIDVEPGAGEEQARAAARRLTATPFDLRRGPLLRVGLIHLAPDDHVLVVVMHHIVADGWSKQVLVEELMALYRARVQGTEDAALPALPVRYADYAAWQRHWLEAGEGARQLDYWRRQLGGTSPALQLPSDQARRADGRYQAAAFDAELPEPLVQALQRRAQASGATLFTLLLTGFQVLLHRHSGESDIRVGVPVANRHRAEVERVVGFFVNMQVLRNAIDGRMPLAHVLAQAREAALGAQAHQDLPFEQLVDALRPERSLSVNPLFQVAFNHERTDGRAFEGLPGLQAEGYALPDPAAQFELVLNTAESHDGRVNATFIYAAELFSAEAMERLSGHYTAILQALAATPELAAGDVALLSACELAQLAAWSINPEREPAFEPIHRQIARQNPQATALLFADEAWTYGQLNRRSSQLAHRLRRQGVGPDTLVGIAMQRSPELIVGILAILKAGGAYLPLDPDQPGARLAAMAAGSGIQWLLIHEATRDLLPQTPELGSISRLDIDHLDLDAEPDSEPDIPLHGDHLAYVIYTSGSTGQPKGAAIRHQALHSCMAWMQRSYRLQPDAGDTVLHKAPIGFDVSCWEIFWPLSCGARLVLAQPGEQRDPERITQLIRRHQVTTLNFVPAMLQAFLAHPGIEEHTRLKHIIVGGEAMPAQTQRQTLQRLKGASLQNLYGPTETTIHVTRWTCRDDGASQVPIGRPISDTQAHILDADLNPVPQGVAGELYIGGVSLARGYLDQAGLTAERFVASPFGRGERLYRTGDQVRWNAEGQIDYLGRLDHQVKIRGLRIELGEVEAQLLGQAEVRQAVVVADEGPAGTRLLAYAALQPGAQVDAATLRQRLARALPDYMVPAAVHVMDVLPLNANGKVDRRALPAVQLEGAQAGEAPQGELETALAAAWAETLALPRVGRHDHFFELGGHSLLALRLLERVRALGYAPPVRTLFQHPTLAAFAQALAGMVPGTLALPGAAAGPLLRLDAAQEAIIEAAVPGGAANIADIYPLSPLQEGMLFHHRLQSQGDTYITPLALAFDSRERLERFVATFERLIARHDALRTALLWEGLPEPVQVVWREARLPLQWLTLPPGADAAAELAAQVHPSRYRIDLRQAPLLRAVAVQDAAAQRWLLQLPSHHMVLDAVSLRLLVEEIAAIDAGREAMLPPSLPYRRHVEQTLQARAAQSHEAFFKDMLGDVDEPTLPFGLHDVQGAAGRADEARCALPDALAAQVRREAQRHGVGAAALFHLAWALVLGQATGRRDVVFGTVLSGRMQGEGAGRAIGLFINTLPLRVRLGGCSVAEGLRQTHDALAQLLEHEHASLALAQRCSAVEGAVPLFSALLNYRSQARGAADLQLGEGVEVLGLHEFSNYPFDLSVDDRGDGFELVALIDRSVGAQRVCGWVLSAVAAIVQVLATQPAQALCALDLLPEAEAHELQAWGANPLRHADAEPVHRLIERHARQTPDAVALVFGGQAYKHAELNAWANRLAHHLIAQGVGPEVRVGIALPRSPEMIVAVLAVLKAGGAYVPLDPAYPADRLAWMAEDSGVALVLAASQAMPGLPAQRLLAIDGLDLSAQPQHDPEPAQHAGQLAYLIYTSGSTGRPKGVGVPHGVLVRHVQESIRFFGLQAHDRMLQFATLNFDGFIEQTFAPLAAGAAIVLRGPELWDSDGFQRAVVEQGITVADLTTAYWLLLAQDFARRAPCALGALRRVHAGGEAMAPEGLQAWRQAGLGHIELLNTYGPTEAAVTASVHDCTPYLHGRPVPQRMPIGKPLAERELHVLGPDLAQLPQGAAGELCIGGDLLARGYLGRPALSAERFVADPFSERGGRLYRTGDRVRWNEGGELEYLGRIDHQVKIRGFRVELGEIEAQLLAQPEVREAVVVADAGPQGLRLAGYVSLRAGQAINATTLRDRLAGALPDYMQPAALMVLPALPLSVNGKIDRKALPAPQWGRAGDAGPGREAPAGSMETALAQAWSELLGVPLEDIGRGDSFFALGGHSLLALRLMERVRLLGHAMPVHALFAHPVLADFAQAMMQHGGSEPVAAPPNGIPPGCTAIEPAMLTLVELDAAQIARIAAAVPGGAANIADIYPLAPLQEGMLFHHRLQERGDAYVTPLALAFDSRERLERFVACLNRVIARHDILRTAVLWEGLPEPLQVVLREATLPIAWQPAAEAAPDVAQALAALADPAHFRIDVRQAPMLRALAAHDRAHARWLLQLPSHHLVLDHTTLELLVGEIALMQQGRDAELPAPVPYRRFVAQALHGVSAAEHEAFFTRMLADVDEPTAPFGLLDVRGDGTRVREAQRRLPADLSRRLREQARRHGVVPATLFHLAWALVLGQATGRDDVVFGTVLFGRMQGGQDSGRAWGLFINTLPLRVRLGATGTADCLHATPAALAGLLRHEHARLSLAQRCSGLAGGAPLFTALLNYRYTQPQAAGAELLEGMQVLGADERTNYPFTLSVDDLGEDFELVAQIHEAVDAGRIGALMQAALEGIADALQGDAARPVCEIALLDAEERARIERWSANAEDCGAFVPVHALIARRAALRPDAEALCLGDAVMRYGELDAQANRVAHRLRALGVGPEVRVGIAMERSFELVIGLLAILKAGGAYVPLDPDYPADRLAYMAEDSGIGLLLTQSRLAVHLPEPLRGLQAQVRVLALDTLDVSAEPAQEPAVPLQAESLAYVIYTSGSTGRPKGAANRHGALHNRLAWMQSAYALAPGETVLQKTPFSFDVSVWEFFWPLMAGARLALAAPGDHRDPARLAALIQRHGVTTLHFVPSMLQSFLAHADLAACTSLRRVVCSGEALPASVRDELLQRLPGAALYNLYGPTEAAIDVTHHTCTADGRAQVAIGRPIAGLRTYVLDAAMQLVPPGVPGELHLGGLGLGRGYAGRPGLTAERFVADPFDATGGGRLYRTGDLVRWNEDGELDYLGRLDHQIKLRGLRIELGEIEAQLLAQPEVGEAVVVAREDTGAGSAAALVAYVAARPGAPAPDTALLRQRLALALPEHMVPAAIVPLERLPLNANGKLDRKALPAPGQALARAFEPPLGDAETALAAIWAELLGVQRVGRSDHFFELGGHSLLSVQLAARAEAVLQRPLSLQDIFRHPVLKDMAAAALDAGDRKPLAQALSDIDSFIDSMEAA